MTDRTANTEPQRVPVVITGIGMMASLGETREEVWDGIRQGKSGVRMLNGLMGIPDGLIIGAPVQMEAPLSGQLKILAMCQQTSAEALADAHVDFATIPSERFGCAISGHMGDTSYIVEKSGHGHLIPPGTVPWWTQWFPNSACSLIANQYAMHGPRICHSTACASGLVDILSAMRAIQDDQCDIALAGSCDAIHPLLAAGFQQMRVLAHDDVPARACRPFDSTRNGFVMGEGGAMFVLERLDHALARGAKIYAEIASGRMLAEAHHVTGLEGDSAALTRLITDLLRNADLDPSAIEYINAHGTGTQQNDATEIRGIRQALGIASDRVCVSSTKAMMGHLVNAAGSTELAITALALRDGFAPPTMNLQSPAPECDLDCIPLVGRAGQFQHAMKLSVAFGGHLVGVILRRWNDAASGFAYPPAAARAA